jgi:Ser/Thr protein kinase RdoA (MazF antagonist)
VTESFYRLTPDRVLAAVERAGLLPTGHCSALTCLENRVYDVRLEAGCHVVVKFYRPGRWSRPAILAEHQFLFDLRAAEVPVCAPLALADGGSLGCIESIHYAIWPRTGGRAPEEFRDGDLAVLGRLLARIHNAGAARDAPERPQLDAQSAALGPLALLEERGFLAPAISRRYRAAVERVVEIYTEWSRGVPLQRIHGDFHVGNLLRNDGGWHCLDFDDCVVGPAVHDVWMLLPGRDAEGARQRALLIEAYRQMRDFDARWLRLVEPLRAFRFVWYAAWIARRWDDPAFPAAFPHFGSQAYWEVETRDLEEQAAGLQREAAAPAGEPGRDAALPEAPRSNKDYFWDL